MPTDIAGAPIKMTPDGRLASDAAANYVGLSRKTMAQMRSEGRGPKYLKIGRIWYRKVDLDEWLAGHKLVRSPAEERMARVKQ